MTGQELIDNLQADKRVYGTGIVADSPFWPEAIRATGIDFVFIDAEHCPRDRDKLAWMCQAYRSQGLAAIVRIPDRDAQQACMVLDGFADGVMVPYVETVEQARALRGAVKLRPLKGKQLEDILNGDLLPEPHVAEYLAKWNAGRLLVLNIESQTAIDNLDGILGVPDIDALLVGSHDMSINLGVPEQYDHPKFIDAIQIIIDKARARNVGVGVHSWITTNHTKRWIDMGANFIMFGSDHYAVMSGLTENFRDIREHAGESLAKTENSEMVI